MPFKEKDFFLEIWFRYLFSNCILSFNFHSSIGNVNLTLYCEKCLMPHGVIVWFIYCLVYHLDIKCVWFGSWASIGPSTAGAGVGLLGGDWIVRALISSMDQFICFPNVIESWEVVETLGCGTRLEELGRCGQALREPHSFIPISLLPSHQEVSRFAPWHALFYHVLPHLRPQNDRVRWPWTQTLKPMSQNKSFFPLNWFISDILSHLQKLAHIARKLQR